MKTNLIPAVSWTCSFAAAFFFIAGCSKQDSTSAPKTEPAQTTAAPAEPAPAPETVKQAVESAKPAAETAAAEAAQQVQVQTTTSTSQAQEWIDKAKSLIADNKLQEASSILQQLAALKLTPEQQKLVDDLKGQLQKALAGKATTEGASAVGNLLKK